MRTTTLLTVLVAASLSASAFAAPASVAQGAASSVVVSAQTPRASGHLLRDSEVAGLPGTYNLADGQVLRVSFERHKLYAELGENKAELVPAGTNTFVARDDSMKLEFDQVPYATDVALTRK